MEVAFQSNLDAFNKAFAEYMAFTSKTPQEALERKVKNIGIKLWRGFSAHEFGGYPKKKGIALAELKARTEMHRGTKVRDDLLQQYDQSRGSLLEERRELKKEQRHLLRQTAGGHKGAAVAWVSASAGLARNAERRQSLWQKIIGREVGDRQSGIGYLGAAFLWFRTRGKGDNRRVVPNRTGKPIGEVTVDDGQATIIGEVAGLAEVDARYDIIAEAIDSETQDTLEWIDEQQAEAARNIFGIVGALG